MKINSIGYLIKEGARNIYSNRLMSFASIGVLMACLLIIGSAVLFSMNVNSVIGYVEEQNEIRIFLREGIEQSQLDVIDVNIKMINNIYEAKFISRAEGLEEQKKLFGEQAALLDGLENTDTIPLSYRLKVSDLSLLEQTLSSIKKIDGVDEIVAPLDVAEAVVGIKTAVSTAGILIVGILVVVSIMIISNTIKITVFNRRREINIMKYVGATDTFIRLPFIVEGIIIGLVAAGLAYLILWGGYNYLLIWIEENASLWIRSASQSMLLFDEISNYMLIGFTSAGIFIGVMGSLIFVHKHLRV